jgi:NAD(P)-dependent dehydrogenase (short-subunit alcohol dehydrogenase family)
VADAQRFAVVTGAAGGIGQAIVRAFDGAGYVVIAIDIAPRPTDLACAAYIDADLERTVADEDYAAEVFLHITRRLDGQGLRALVNNAAVQVLGGVDSLQRSDWRKTIDTNLLAPFLWTQALLPALEKARGSVVNISSIHARLTKKDFVAYATSKAALSGMTRALAVDLHGRVRVNAIEPAAIGTAMLRAGFEHTPDLLDQLNRMHPAGRIGTPEEVAASALWLASDEAHFLQGACIGLDGGISARLADPG